MQQQQNLEIQRHIDINHLASLLPSGEGRNALLNPSRVARSRFCVKNVFSPQCSEPQEDKLLGPDHRFCSLWKKDKEGFDGVSVYLISFLVYLVIPTNQTTRLT